MGNDSYHLKMSALKIDKTEQKGFKMFCLNGVNLNEPSNLSFSILVSFCSLLTLSTVWNKSSKINEVFKFPLELDIRILF